MLQKKVCLTIFLRFLRSEASAIRVAALSVSGFVSRLVAGASSKSSTVRSNFLLVSGFGASFFGGLIGCFAAVDARAPVSEPDSSLEYSESESKILRGTVKKIWLEIIRSQVTRKNRK